MKHKIMIVDDEEEIRQTIKRQLKDTGYEIIAASNGEEAIKLIGKENVLVLDAIICDIRMPKINGVEAIAHFRKEYPSIPVIVLTGFPDVSLATKFIKDGAFEYLVKPVEKERLIEVVTKAAEQHHLFSSGGGA